MKAFSILKALAVAAPLALMASSALAGPVAAGFNSSTLPANDDGSVAGIVNPGFSMNFFGTTYTGFYINNNGNVTFNSTLSAYTPFGVGAGYSGQPIIAPFFADVDTRGALSGLTSYGTGTYNGESAFGVTWPGVGYYSGHDDKLNTFQLILTNRSDVSAGDFDIYFNYNQIKWETGDFSGGVGGLGGTSAAVGYSNGTGALGAFFQFSGSLTPGALIDGGVDALSTHTNDDVTGQYLFQVRNGEVVPPPVDNGGVPEPASWALMLIGFLGAGAALRSARRKTVLATD
jgi:Nidogen-like/PEP-CTERM motif